MAEAEETFTYLALSPVGAQVKGTLAAGSELAAYERLRRDGLSPVRLKPARSVSSGVQRIALSDRRAAELFGALGVLLSAGADIRSALAMLGSRAASRPALQLCKLLADQVSGGARLDEVLAQRLPSRQGFAAALVSAGEASGELGSGFTRAAEVLSARTRLADQLVSTLSYPAFVLVSTVAAVLTILLFVVPTLAPLVETTGASAPPTLAVLLWASRTLSGNLVPVAAVGGGGVLGLLVAGRLGLLAEPVDRLLLDGPSSELRGGLVYGAFAIVLGNMLAAGAPLGDALRLAVRTAPSAAARGRLEHAAAQVRQGRLLSSALDQVRRFPPAIVRMCAVGESSGSLGLMLSRAGRLEEEAALRRIEALGRLLGPALIVLLGGLVGLLMATLLSGVSQIGQGIGS